MEITKQNEVYRITDSFETWTTEGTAQKDITGAVNINFYVSGENSERVGDCGYFRPNSSESESINLNIAESNRDKFVTYINTVINTILEHFAE